MATLGYTPVFAYSPAPTAISSVKNTFINIGRAKTADTFSVNQKTAEFASSFWENSFNSYVLAAEIVKPVKQTISGQVVSGGDTTPEGFYDIPREFIYQVKQDSGTIVKVTYIAYPPSPLAYQERKKIRLSFYSGSIKTGDYLKAYGSFDENTQTLTVTDEGDYIETSTDQTTTQQKNGNGEVKQKTILETSKIIEKLLNENRITQINSISLQADQQTYQVTATKRGRLFFFIPIRLNIQMAVDATSGTVKKTKTPWWSFLVRF